MKKENKKKPNIKHSNFWLAGLLMFILLAIFNIANMGSSYIGGKIVLQSFDYFMLAITLTGILLLSVTLSLSLKITEKKNLSYSSSLVCSLITAFIFYIITLVLSWIIYARYITAEMGADVAFQDILLYGPLYSIIAALVFFFIPSVIYIYTKEKGSLEKVGKILKIVSVIIIILSIIYLSVSKMTCSLNNDGLCLLNKAIRGNDSSHCLKLNEQKESLCLFSFCSINSEDINCDNAEENYCKFYSNDPLCSQDKSDPEYCFYHLDDSDCYCASHLEEIDCYCEYYPDEPACLEN